MDTTSGGGLSRTPYQVLRLRAPAVALDSALAEFCEGGCLGAEFADDDPLSRCTVYFRSPPEEDLAECRSAWSGIAVARGCEVLGWATLEEQDWLEPYRSRAGPFDLGRGFVVDPGEPAVGPAPRMVPTILSASHHLGRPLHCMDGLVGPKTPMSRDRRVADPPGRCLLRLPARQAFGVGSHETTQLVVELLERPAAGVAGRHVLDVGSGTGVLGFVALHLGAVSVIGLDIDPAAVFAARCNRTLNQRASWCGGLRLVAGGIEALASAERADLVLVNILAETIAPHQAAVRGCMALDGDLIVSGVLTERAEAVEAQWQGLGLQTVARRQKGEWTAFHFRSSASA